MQHAANKAEKCKNDFQSDDNFSSRSVSPEDRSVSVIWLVFWSGLRGQKHLKRHLMRHLGHVLTNSDPFGIFFSVLLPTLSLRFHPSTSFIKTGWFPALRCAQVQFSEFKNLHPNTASKKTWQNILCHMTCSLWYMSSWGMCLCF